MAHDLAALLGRGSLGRSILRGARGQRGLAAHDDAIGVAGGASPHWARVHSDRLLCRDGRMGPACRGEPDLREGPPRSPGGRPARGALAPRGLLAELPDQVPRDQRPAQADAADLGQGHRDGARVDARPCPRPPVPGPVERLLLARPVRWHLHQSYAAGHVRAPDSRRGPRRLRGRRAACDRAARPGHGRAG